MIKFLIEIDFQFKVPLPTAKITPKMKFKFTYLYILKSPFCVNKEVIGGGGDTSPRTPPPLRHCEGERCRCQVGYEKIAGARKLEQTC